MAESAAQSAPNGVRDIRAMRVRSIPGRAVLHLVQALTWLGAVYVAESDPAALAPALGSVAVFWAHWFLFLRTNPRMVGIELAVLLMATYYSATVNHYTALWIGASALGGGIGALLSVQARREDDFFFLPPAATLGFFALLSYLAEGCRLDEPFAQLAAWVAGQRELHLEVFRQSQIWQQLETYERHYYTRFLEWATLLTPLAMWVPGLWVSGRWARRRSGWLHARRAPLLLFRIQERYIFLLICGILLWIVGILTGREQAALYVAAPLLTVFAVACCVEGLAVAMFRLALWRALSPQTATRPVVLLVLILAVWLSQITLPLLLVVGLTDIWFDFRRLSAVEERLESDR